mgnify:CR=1 FL=1
MGLENSKIDILLRRLIRPQENLSKGLLHSKCVDATSMRREWHHGIAKSKIHSRLFLLYCHCVTTESRALITTSASQGCHRYKYRTAERRLQSLLELEEVWQQQQQQEASNNGAAPLHVRDWLYQDAASNLLCRTAAVDRWVRTVLC